MVDRAQQRRTAEADVLDLKQLLTNGSAVDAVSPSGFLLAKVRVSKAG
jgi:hypothetical protein